MFVHRRRSLFVLFSFFIIVLLAPIPATFQVQSSIHPLVAAIAEQNPQQNISIIVQKADISNQAERLVSELGGVVTKDLSMIQAFAAEIQAGMAPQIAASSAVRWVSLDAPVHQTGSGSETARDEFESISYSNNDGTAVWAGDWTEIGESTNANSGQVKIHLDELRLHQPDKGIRRSINLANATSAAISFDIRRQNLLAADDAMVLEVSADDGTSWTELARFEGPANDAASQTVSYDMTGYTSADTTIRFVTGSTFLNGFMYIDNLQIEFVNNDHDHLQAINALALWEVPSNLQGQGITVAVVDSGIDSHADLNSRVVARVQLNSTSTGAEDFYGHGTHIAGLIGGDGSASNGSFMGVAPQVNLVDVKVLDDTGAGSMSDVIAGLQWIYENKALYNIQVVNLSLNSAVAESYHTSPLNAAVEILWFNEIVVVVAAGNNGVGAINPPANDPFVITVGATDSQDTADLSDDTLAAYSAFGTTSSGFAKPDLVAPGVDLISPLSGDSNFAAAHPAHVIAGPYSNDYIRLSGTSMSAAVTSGAVALLLQDEPGLNPDQVKYRLMATAVPFNGPVAGSTGAGYLDIGAAVNATTMATANTGLEASQLLWTGSDPVNWGSVNWSSVNWSSVNWSSVNWSSVHWDN